MALRGLSSWFLLLLTGSTVIAGKPLPESAVEVDQNTDPTTESPTSPDTSLSTTDNNTDCDSIPQCSAPWDGENWTDDTVRIYGKEEVCINETYVVVTQKIECTIKSDYFGLSTSEECVTRYVAENRVREVCTCSRTSNRRSTISAWEEISISCDTNYTIDAVWQMSAPNQSKIALFLKEYCIDCPNQTLTINDGPCGEPTKLCDCGNNTTVISTTGQIQMKFTGSCSNSSATSEGSCCNCSACPNCSFMLKGYFLLIDDSNSVYTNCQ